MMTYRYLDGVQAPLRPTTWQTLSLLPRPTYSYIVSIARRGRMRLYSGRGSRNGKWSHRINFHQQCVSGDADD